jgi:hypothetical protein
MFEKNVADKSGRKRRSRDILYNNNIITAKIRNKNTNMKKEVKKNEKPKRRQEKNEVKKKDKEKA